MHSSLSWIEWLERLDRTLAGARQDLAAVARARSPRRVDALEGSRRRLAALVQELHRLDLAVLATAGAAERAGDLQAALETAQFRLAALAHDLPADHERCHAAADVALRESRRAAASLVAPQRMRA
jgi:hypothetical protein